MKDGKTGGWGEREIGEEKAIFKFQNPNAK